MEIITKFPKIAIAFGILALVTALVLIFNTLKIINYILAVFWFITGLLAIFTLLKNTKSLL